MKHESGQSLQDYIQERLNELYEIQDKKIQDMPEHEARRQHIADLERILVNIR